MSLQPGHSVGTPVLSVVMVGATGAVGGSTVKALLTIPQVELLTLLGRRPVPIISGSNIRQEMVDIFDASSYARFLPGHNTAICTLAGC
jgi:nucleoside-diphosphate-sugar epimerase